MSRIEESIAINAPAKRVLAYMAESSNLMEVWPNLLEVRNLKPLPHGGDCSDRTYEDGELASQSSQGANRARQESAHRRQQRDRHPQQIRLNLAGVGLRRAGKRERRVLDCTGTSAGQAVLADRLQDERTGGE